MNDDHFYTWINDRFNRLEEKIDSLQEWKWKLSGAVIVVAFITSALIAWMK